MNKIRQATKDDVFRIAEILVFSNRINYFPIFNDEEFSFKEMNVLNMMDRFLNREKIENIYVYDDGVIKGFIYINNKEVKKLYVEHMFIHQGIGRKLMEFAIDKFDVNYLWALEKNINAINFYHHLNFLETNEKVLEEGTNEYLVKLIRK